ncbi:MAG TPA: HAMP domain-containing protein [Herpetosiphonaceae bacterium]|nr:HAMP domain-containing protein [Herpetosiphonaceae bacterium]
MNVFRRLGSRLRTKLLVILLLAALAPLLILAFFSVRFTRAALIAAAEQSLVAAAGQTATSLDAFINANLDAVRTEAQIPALVRALENGAAADREEAAVVVRGLSRKDTLNIVSYGLVTAAGETVVDTVSANVGGSAEASADYVAISLQSGLPFVSPVTFGPGAEQGLMTFSAPVRSSSGAILGVLRVRYRASVLQQLLVQNADQQGSERFAILIDENGLRLADSRAVELIHTLIAPLPADRAAQLGRAGRLPADAAAQNLAEFNSGLAGIDQTPAFIAALYPDDAAPSQVAAARVKRQHWAVVFALPRTAFLAPIQSQVRTTLILLIALAVGVSLAAVVLARLLTGPLLRLTEAARQVAGGNLATQAPVTSSDEIGTLAAAFNGMTAQLAQTMEGLELRVAERTQALQQALDTQAAQSRQLQEALEAQRQLDEQVAALSMPIIPVQAGVLVVPLVGNPDTASLLSGQDRLLNEVVARHARTVMIDVTGMTLIDTQTSLVLIQMANAIGLLGARLVLVGVRPEVAQSLVTLGVELDRIETHATLQSALGVLARGGR